MKTDPEKSYNSDRETNTISTSSNNGLDIKSQSIIDLPRDYMQIRKLVDWKGAKIKQISAGFNHSAFITSDGQLYTWGKSLEMQLGHGNKRDRLVPTFVTEPVKITWAAVECCKRILLIFGTACLNNDYFSQEFYHSINNRRPCLRIRQER